MVETDSPTRRGRGERLAPFFDVQLCLARQLTALNGNSLGDNVLRFTSLHRRFGLGRPDKEAPGAEWHAYARMIEATADPVKQLAITVQQYVKSSPEVLPLPGQTPFGCFACETPDSKGDVRIHFHNLDTDAAGGPLVRAKLRRRKEELAALVHQVITAHPEAKGIRGGSWLYHVEAYRRLFPEIYLAAATPHPGPSLTGSSSWGQLIDSQEHIRADVRDQLLSRLPGMDANRPWTVFPRQPLVPYASIEVFRTHCLL